MWNDGMSGMYFIKWHLKSARKEYVVKKYVTEVWVQFSSYELFLENREKLVKILKKAEGECTLYVCTRDNKEKCYQSMHYFDESKIHLLVDTFGVENVKSITKLVTVKSRSEIIECCGNCIERIADALERIADTLEERKDGMKEIINLADVEPCSSSIVAFYDRYRSRIANIETVEQRNEILADMEERFRGYIRVEPQIRNQLSETYELLKRKCWEAVPW